MSATFACIAGEEIFRPWDERRIAGRRVEPRQTPLGASGEMFLIESADVPFYLLPRYGTGTAGDLARRGGVNHRANLYALKDLGVQYVLGWGPGGAITHNYAVGDLVILSDLVDHTYLRPKTFFENSPLGFLRQFPVFCPTLRRLAGEVLHDMRLVCHGTGTAAVSEGPRMETPAEIRLLAGAGAEIATHAFVPEAFLAKELQLCFAAVCYIVNYAETGSRHRPFAAGDLFGGLTQKSEQDRLASAVGSLGEIIHRIASAVPPPSQSPCECQKTMAHHVAKYHLGDDWRTWFA
ncbi:MAG: S-methyl-5'-thioadenosine phosphorylase [Planctomycetes bacterium ADurb.Bin126]|nr:MAG: S-methyl-5'-thioadenosine phosphorylase [Planctomycetes bacterium ADurb.Bin126]HOD80198.1 MTAP family purine nucleoside phosphorylase [Phycisphaerae bacterium]HQL71670.1 MTAP family purine nucleoside phosphorylase [Phycisphaerae bacterium]